MNAAVYPKKADYPDLPFEVVVVERNPSSGDVLHVEVVARHSLASEAYHRAQAFRNSLDEGSRYTVELVTPVGMVKA